MDLDAAQTAAATLPYLIAAAKTYGVATLSKIADDAVDQASTATVAWGRRLAAKLLGESSRPLIEASIEELGLDPDSPSAAEKLCRQISATLANDESLHAAVAELLASANQEIAAQRSGDNHQVTQNIAGWGNAKQAVMGSGVQNVDFGK